MSSAKEVFLANNSCAIILKMCIGKTTTVELRDESFVTGRVVEVDGFMNVSLKSALFVDSSHKHRRRFDEFFIQNRLVRYVQIPLEVDIEKELKNACDPEARGRGRGRGRGGEVSLARKKILSIREQRRMEDLENALKFKKEEEEKKRLRELKEQQQNKY